MNNELKNTTVSEETAVKRLPKYKAGLCFSERDLQLEDIADQIVELLAEGGVSHTEWRQVFAFINKAIGEQCIQTLKGNRMKYEKQLTITNWAEFQRIAREAREKNILLQTSDGLLNPEVFGDWQFEFSLADVEDSVQ